MIGLVRSELLKIRTTKTWWLFGIFIVLLTAIMQLIWIIVANEEIHDAITPFVPNPDLPPEAQAQAAQAHANQPDLNAVLLAAAGRFYTAGSFFTGVFILLLGVLIVTNEYYHQTATATFLDSPHRVRVIFAKIGAAILAAATLWLFTGAINITTGAIYFGVKGYDNQLGEWEITRTMLMYGLVLVIWAIFGIGLGVLIRNQIGAVVTGTAAYLLGFPVALLVTSLLDRIFDGADWVEKSLIAWPAVASLVMTSGSEGAYPNQPKWWVAALVLTGYGVVSGAIGTVIMRRRDIS